MRDGLVRFQNMELFLAAAAALPWSAQADMANGKKLYQENCVACHARMVGGDGSSLFTRPDRRVSSLAGLGKQVSRCRDNLGLTWFDVHCLSSDPARVDLVRRSGQRRYRLSQCHLLQVPQIAHYANSSACRSNAATHR